MKNIFCIAALLMISFLTSAQVRKALPVRINQTIVKQPLNTAYPQKLVYVFPVANNGDVQLKYIGKLIFTSVDSLMMVDFYENYTWMFKKWSDGRLDRKSPDYVSAINRIYICSPQGPVTQPGTNNLVDRDYAAICLSDGHIIYAKINGGFYLKKSAYGQEVAPGSGYVSFQEEYDKGKFNQITLNWDASTKKWTAEKENYAPNQWLKNGATVNAVYSYEVSGEFYRQD